MNYSIVITRKGVPLLSEDFDFDPASLIATTRKYLLKRRTSRKPGREGRSLEVVALIPERFERYLEGRGHRAPLNGKYAQPVEVGQVFLSGEAARIHLGLNTNEIGSRLDMGARDHQSLRSCEAARLRVPFAVVRGVALSYKNALDAARTANQTTPVSV